MHHHIVAFVPAQQVPNINEGSSVEPEVREGEVKGEREREEGRRKVREGRER